MVSGAEVPESQKAEAGASLEARNLRPTWRESKTPAQTQRTMINKYVVVIITGDKIYKTTEVRWRGRGDRNLFF